MKLHGRVFLSVKPIITYMSAQFESDLLGVRVPHIWSESLPLQTHLMKHLHNKQTLNRRIFIFSLKHKEMRTASLLLLRLLFVLQRRVSDIQVPILWRSWFPPPQVLEQLPQEVQSSNLWERKITTCLSLLRILKSFYSFCRRPLLIYAQISP